MPKPNPIPRILSRLTASLTDLERSELERDQSYQAIVDALKRAEMAARNMAKVINVKKDKK